MKKKIKIFLGGYVNTVNAQNINCRSIAIHLNKNKFEIAALKLYSGTLETDTLKDIRLIETNYPHKITKYISYLKGILWADVVYLPKGELPKFTIFLTKLFNKNSFSTVEGVFDELAQQNAINYFGSIQDMKKYFHAFDHLYSITKFMSKRNRELIDLQTEDKVLYLGTDVDVFINKQKEIKALKNTIIIGNDLVRKGIFDYLELAKTFPKITFHIVGTGNGKIDVNETLQKESINNVVYHGGLPHHELKKLLEKIDLHIFPSRSEGFPKVTLETAAAGVPSLVYSDYGATEWIKHGKNGFVVNTLDEMKKIIENLLEHPHQLQEISENSVKLAIHFDWKEIIKDWEQVIENLMENKN